MTAVPVVVVMWSQWCGQAEAGTVVVAVAVAVVMEAGTQPHLSQLGSSQLGPN